MTTYLLDLSKIKKKTARPSNYPDINIFKLGLKNLETNLKNAFRLNFPLNRLVNFNYKKKKL